MEPKPRNIQPTDLIPGELYIFNPSDSDSRSGLVEFIHMDTLGNVEFQILNGGFNHGSLNWTAFKNSFWRIL